MLFLGWRKQATKRRPVLWQAPPIIQLIPTRAFFSSSSRLYFRVTAIPPAPNRATFLFLLGAFPSKELVGTNGAQPLALVLHESGVYDMTLCKFPACGPLCLVLVTCVLF